MLKSSLLSGAAVAHKSSSTKSSGFTARAIRPAQRSANASKVTCSAQNDEEMQVSRRDFGVAGPAAAAVTAALSALPNPALAAATITGQWEQVDLGLEPGVILLDIAFTPSDPKHGFLLGTRQTVLETKDGGKTWDRRYLGETEEDQINYRFQNISFSGKEGYIIGKPAILYHTTDGGTTWDRVPLSARLPGNPLLITALDDKGTAEMATDEGAIYTTSDAGQRWKAAVEETVSATLNRTVSSGISGASYYTGNFATIQRSPYGDYVGVTNRGNFYMTWQPGQTYWQPHNRSSSRRIQGMGWRTDGGLWLIARGGELFYGDNDGVTEGFEQRRIGARGFGILDVGFKNDQEVWASGGSGSLFRSVDGGSSWQRDKEFDNLAANLYSVKFMNDGKTGFVLGNDGILLRYR